MSNLAVPAWKPQTQQKSRAKRQGESVWIVLGLALLNVAVYWQLNRYQFLNFDDDAYITDNPSVAAGFTWDGVRWAFTAIDYFYWQPLTWLSHMLDCQLFGLNAGSHHFTNVAIHLINAVLVFALLRRMTGFVWRSGVAAALFSLHPLAVESVAWVAERKNLLGGLLWLLTMWSYVWYVERPSSKRYQCVLIMFIAGLMAKPVVVTLPLILLLIDYWPLRRPEWHRREGVRRLVIEKLPLIVLATLSSFLTYVGTKRMGAMDILGDVSTPTRVANAAYSYIRYLEFTIWPRGLAILYPYDRSLALWKGLVCGVVLAAATFGVFRVRKTAPYLLVGWLWFLAALVPMIGLVQVGAQAMADRFTYVPLLGLLIAAVWAAGNIFSGRPRTAAALAGVAVFLCTGCSWVQAGYWKDSATVFERAIAVTRNNMLAEYHLGWALEKQGRLSEAISHFRETTRIDPESMPGYYATGSALATMGKYSEAADSFRLAIRYQNNYADAYYFLALMMVQAQRAPEAIEPFRQALKLGIKPEFAAQAHDHLGMYFVSQGENEKALAEFRAAVNADANLTPAQKNLGVALVRAGRQQDALEHFRRVLAATPQDQEIIQEMQRLNARVGVH
ncbi:MAG: hypothetical protein DMG57_13915 [Acidobacteria bacterium]|nr:MAG: hypothetical protein DMG57_13915 [Acidobacteriota bacterium]